MFVQWRRFSVRPPLRPFGRGDPRPAVSLDVRVLVGLSPTTSSSTLPAAVDDPRPELALRAEVVPHRVGELPRLSAETARKRPRIEDHERVKAKALL